MSDKLRNKRIHCMETKIKITDKKPNTGEKKKFLYESLATELESKIHQKVFKPGEKLPAIREMHKQLNKSITTISKAYEILEQKDLISARDRSGYFVKGNNHYNLKKPAKSYSNLSPKLIHRSGLVEEVLGYLGDETKIQLGVAYISPKLFPLSQYSKILKNLTHREIRKTIVFDKPQGILSLRQQISLRYLNLVKNISPEDIIITNGCTEALVICLMTLLKKGDTVAIEVPSFYGIFTMLENMGVFVLELPTDSEHGVDYDALKHAVESKGIKCCILNANFHNPLGSLMSDHKKGKIVTFLNNHDIPIIEDDIYSELYYEKHRPLPLKHFDKKNLVLTCSSFSKTLAPGLRVGWIIPGKKFHSQILQMKSGISISTSTLDQYVLAKFIATGRYDKHLRRFRNLLRKQLYMVLDAINKYFPQEIRMIVPKGGFLLWIQLPDGVNSIKLYKKLLEKNIIILPGPVCSSSGGFEAYIRLNCGYPFDDVLENALKIIGKQIKSEMMSR